MLAATLPALAFPAIDPVALEIGPFALRWYALAYIAGIVLGWLLARRLAALAPQAATRDQLDDLVTWVTLGIILGGRFGYVLFYRPGYYVTAPWEALYVWQGGMSFHGGMLGVALAVLWYARRQRLDPLVLADRVAPVAPIGLFLGRLANFANGELWGRVTDVPWGMVFPHAGPEPRHPSQLYQAFLEGICLFVILQLLVRIPALRARPGLIAGVFLAGYAVARMLGELFRQPDAHLGFLLPGITMGQLLSLPMLAAGLWLIARARRRPAVA
jgi:phosphatidylglycerol:prolipoprotein diacylglycerol transferase